MLTIDPKHTPIPQLFGYLTGAIGPRPIAFASTVDATGAVNLAPFSFFNVFGANPPILVFSPSRSGRDNTTKNTLDNVQAVPEVVINVVNYAIVQQMSLSSTAYKKGINEFVKAGLTEVPSEMVQPPRVGESPIQLECRVNEIKPLGDQGGAGNLVICEILKIHINPDILDEAGTIDPIKIDQVARMGSNWYSRANAGLFEIPKPLAQLGIGVDQIPEAIRSNPILDGNDLGMLGNIERLPTADEVNDFINANPELQEITVTERFKKAKDLLQHNNITDAWKVLLSTIK